MTENFLSRFKKYLQQILKQFCYRIFYLTSVKYKKINPDYQQHFDDLKNHGICHLKGFIKKNNLKKFIKNYITEIDKLYKSNGNETVNLEVDKGEIIKFLTYEPNGSILYDLISSYLGKNLIAYERKVSRLSGKKENASSWQPHHDTRFNRVKVYIWIKSEKKSHPLFYLKGTHLSFKFWYDNFKDYRKNNINENELFRILGDIGDITIFDTHALHSFYKQDGQPRDIFSFSVDPINNFFGWNSWLKLPYKHRNETESFSKISPVN